MGYVRTGGMSTAARRRRRRTALVLGGLLLVLALVFAYAYAYSQGWLTSEEEAGGDTATATATATAAPPEPADIVVNVYNANGAPGLAAQTAEAVSARGYTVDTIADDPEQAEVEGVADIRHGPSGLEAAQVLQAAVPGAELVPDEREGSEIDLVVGDAWEELPEAPVEDEPEPDGR